MQRMSLYQITKSLPGKYSTLRDSYSRRLGKKQAALKIGEVFERMHVPTTSMMKLRTLKLP